jgi:O-antigen/teichoic acid export membrane protein
MAARRVRLRIAFNKERIVWFLKESIPLFIYIGLAMLYERLDVLLLSAFYDEARIGIYSSAFRLTAPLIFLPFVVTQSLYPVMSRVIEGEEERRGMIFSMGLKILFVLGLALGFFGLIAGGLLYRMIYGGGFMEGLIPFQCLLWGQAFNFLTFFIVDYNSSQNRQKRNAVFVVCVLALALVVDWILISQFGVIGAGAAKLMLYLSGVLILITISGRDMDRFQIKTFFRVFFLLLFLMIAAGGLTFSGAGLWLKIVLMGSMFSGAVLWIFSPEEKDNLLRGLRTVLHSGPRWS